LPLRDAINPKVWKKCYTLQDIESCLSRVQVVGFNEKKVSISKTTNYKNVAMMYEDI
jgi:hypothetical protein